MLFDSNGKSTYPWIVFHSFTGVRLSVYSARYLDIAFMPPSTHRRESSGRRRKHRNSAESPATPQLPCSQKSLPEAFKASQESIDSLLEGPSNKRTKLRHIPNPHPPTILAASNMYNFSKPNHIDLTNGSGPAMMTTVQKKPVGMARSSDTSGHSEPKRLIVKNLRKSPRSDPEVYFNHVWSQLDAALSAIIINEKLPYSNEELYRGAENLCRQGRAAPLFEKLCEKCRHGIWSQFEKQLVDQARNLDDIVCLRATIEAWDAWNVRLVCHCCCCFTHCLPNKARKQFDRYSFSLTDLTSFILHHCLLSKIWARMNSDSKFSHTVPSNRVY